MVGVGVGCGLLDLLGRGLGLGRVELGLEVLLLVLGGEVDGLGGGEVALAGLAGLVGEDGEVREGLLGRVDLGDDLLGADGLVGLPSERKAWAIWRARRSSGLAGSARRTCPRRCRRRRAGGGRRPCSRSVAESKLSPTSARRTRAWASAAQAAGSRGAALALASAVWTWVVRRSTAASSPPPAGAVAGDGVDDAAGQAARADAEADEAHEHEQGEAEVDNLDGAAASAASEIEQHGSCGLVLIAGDVLWLRGSDSSRSSILVLGVGAQRADPAARTTG